MLLPKPVPKVYKWSFDAANTLLKQPLVDDHDLTVLRVFLDHTVPALAHITRLHAPDSGDSLDNSTKILNGNLELADVDPTILKDASVLGDFLNINHVDACEFIVTLGEGSSILDRQVDRIHGYARQYFWEWRAAIRLLRILFERGTETDPLSRLDALASEYTSKIIAANSSFWLDIVSSIRTTLTEGKQRLSGIEDSDEPIPLLFSENSARCLDFFQVLVVGAANYPMTADFTVSFFELAAETELFSFIIEDSHNPNTNFLGTMHALGVVTLLALLDTEGLFINDPRGYSKSNEALIKIQNRLHSIFKDSRGSSIVALAWSLILDRLSIVFQDKKDVYYSSFVLNVLGRSAAKVTEISNSDPFRTPVSKTVSTDPVVAFVLSCQELSNYAGELAGTALRLGALERLTLLLKCLPEDPLYTDICRGVLRSSMPYIKVTDQVARVIRSVVGPHPHLAESFFQDEFVIRALLLAKGQVPIAITPFIYMVQCFPSDDAFDLVHDMTSFLIALPESFRGYEFDKGEVVLSSDCTVIPPRTTDREGAIVIPSGTIGKVLSSDSENNLVIVLFNKRYNGWMLLFRMMELVDQNKSWDDPDSDISFDEMVKLLTTTVTELDDAKINELVVISSEILGYGDIIEMVTKRLDYAIESKNIEASMTGIKFLTALLPSMPQRVWPYLSRSRLLERNGQGGMLEAILGSVELVNCDFRLTLTVIKFTEALVQNALLDALSSNISESVKKNALSSLLLHLLLIFESFSSWRYSKPRQRLLIAINSISIFRSILAACYGINDDRPLNEKATGILSDVCKTIVQTMLSHSERSVRIMQPILKTIESAASSDGLDLDEPLQEDELKSADSVFRLCALLIRVRMISRLPPSLLEQRLFEQAPHLAQALDRYAALRSSVLQTFDALVSADWNEPSPPSLLAFLGPQNSHIFLTRLASLISNELESGAIYQACYCISSIISSKQEGLSILLLSGKQKDGRRSKNGDMPLLRVLEDNIINRNTNDFAPEIMAPMLDVICLAHSAWTISAGENLTELCNSLVDLVNELVPVAPDDDIKHHQKVLRRSNSNLMAARALQILAIQLYKSPDGKWSDNFLKYLKSGSNLLDISKRGFSVHGMRLSLHGNLHRNFEAKWGKVTLDAFSRSSFFGRKRYDMRYLFDIQLMDIILGRDPVWTGYRKEVIEANVNLSYIDSQFVLIRGWCCLLNVLSSYAGRVDDRELLKLLQPVGELAIQHVTSNELSLPLFEQTNKLRLDAAYHVMVFLSKSKLFACNLELIQGTFNMLVDPSLDFLSSLGELSSQNKLYRVLLKILDLELEAFIGAYKKSKAGRGHELAALSQLLPLIQGVVDVVAIRGMRAICTAAQTDPSGGYVEDVVVCTLILRKCLQVPGVESLAGAWVLSMKETESCRTVMSLFSNSLNLTVKDGDAIYGELTLLFFQEWLKIVPVAEHFVNEGLLRLLYESPISKQIQRGEVDVNSNLRLYHIWTKGIIGIVLQLVRQLQVSILPETVVWINYFSRQTMRALERWNDVQYISFSVIEETSQLLLILCLVKMLCKSDENYALQSKISSEVVWNTQDLLSSIDYLLDHQKYLASKLLVITIDEQQKYVKDKTGMLLVSEVVTDLEELRDFLQEVST